jgi:hypothetical protein
MVTLVLTPETKTAGNVKFTVDRRTGRGQPGASREDCLLVQFCLRLLRESNHPTFATQIPQQTLSGQPGDQAMIDGILAFQAQSPSMVNDGYCSPFGRHSFGGGVFTLSLMEGTIIARNARASAVWPRIDLLDECPPDLAAAAKREIGTDQLQLAV